MTMINKKLLIRAGAVVSSVLGPTLSPLGVDVKKLTAELNALTKQYTGKVFVNVAISQKETQITMLPFTDAYQLKCFKKNPDTLQQNLRTYAESSLKKSYAQSLDSRIKQLNGILRSITS